MSSSSVSYERHRFPPPLIAHAVWLYFRFPLSLRLVEEMLLERGIVVSYETIRRWGGSLGHNTLAVCVESGPPATMSGISTSSW